MANIDLKKAMALINNALSDMFHFIEDKNIAKFYEPLAEVSLKLEVHLIELCLYSLL